MTNFEKNPQILNTLLTNSNKREEDIDIGNIPLHGLPLRKLIIELIKSNNKLQKDVKELKRWVQTKKKKIIMIDWLNDNYAPNQNYKEFISKFVITRKHLEIIFQSNNIDGIQEIFQEYMSNTDNINIPFKSFDQKDNTIYVYNENLNWELLSASDFNNIVSIISKGILTEFANWQNENEHQLYDDDFSIIYIKNTRKILGNIPIDKQRNKIHRNLYQYLKMNLQNTIHYEFL